MVGGYPVALWVLLIAATICDLVWGKIFNWLSGLFLALGLVNQLWFVGAASILSPLLAIAAAFLFFFPLYRLKVFAAGDVKLLMAVGAWSSPALVFELGLTAILFGAAVGLIVILRTHGLRFTFASLKKHLSAGEPSSRQGLRMPFAPAFLCALLFMQFARSTF